MRRRRLNIAFILWMAASAWLYGIVPGAHAANAGAEFRRGIGISDVMAWAAVEPDNTRQFVYPAFTGVTDARFAGELRTLRRNGFDFVRFAVDPGPFLQFGGSRRDFLDRMLIERVNVVLAAGLSVVVDFHPSDMNPDYTAAALTGGRRTPVFQSYLQLLQRTAELLGQIDSRGVALELMNEPPVPQDVWQPMLEAAYAAARAGSPDLPLVLEGGEEASPSALMKMTVARFVRDPAVLYSYHYYDPYQFTHQGAAWNPARYLADVPYPAVARPLDDSLTATAAAIGATDLSEPKKSLAFQDAQARLEDYRASGFGRDSIGASFAQIARWAKSNGIPANRVMLGEFGARKTVLQSLGGRARERAQWFHDVSGTAAANGFGWAVWAYRGGGFGLAQSDASDEIEPDIADALGLDFSKPPSITEAPTPSRRY